MGRGPNWTKLDLWMIRNNNIGQFFFKLLKISRGAFAMLLLCKKFFSVFEIFHTKLSVKNILGIQNVPLRLFFNNNHLRFGCLIIICGHHLSKNIIASQFFSAFSVLIFWPKLTFWAIFRPNNTI